MSRARVVRKPMPIEQALPGAVTTALPTWTPVMGRGRVDLSFLASIPSGRRLVQCLIDWQQGMRGGYTVGLDVRRFLLHVAERGELVGSTSLHSYRSRLDTNASISDKARQSYYSNAAAFVRRLISQGLLAEQDLPPGFRGAKSAPKKTFVEKAADWSSVVRSAEFAGWLERTSAVSRMDANSCQHLAVSEGWMALLEKQAGLAVRNQLDDWKLTEGIVARKNATTFEEQWRTRKSVETALGLLYERFGYLVPKSAAWPAGLVDYCKYRGWPPDRVRAAWFPTAKALDAFLVLALANAKLVPNVDSVLFYAFVGCVTSTDDLNMARIRLGKFRGSDAEAILDGRSDLIRGFRALEAVVVRALEDIEDVPGLQRDGGIPLFLHVDGRSLNAVRRFDPSTAANMVRRFVALAARSQPLLGPLVGRVTGENFRPTHLLCSDLRGNSIFRTQALAKHKDPSTTAGYLKRAVVEAAVLRRHQDFQLYLVSEAGAQSARRLGNGFHCAPQNEEHGRCVRIDMCGAGESGCPARKIVLESPHIVAEWVAWSDHIRGRAEYLAQHRPERWQAVWGPRLVEYEVLLEGVSESAKVQARQLVGSVQLLPLE